MALHHPLQTKTKAKKSVAFCLPDIMSGTQSNLKPPPVEISPNPTDDDDSDANNDDEEENLDDPKEDMIILNVGGIRYETRLQTLKKNNGKNSRLLDIAEEFERTGKSEFYFDRQSEFFPYILNFYRTGKLHLPLNVCGPLIKEELNFWQIDDKDIEQCCWVHYIKYEETLEMIDMFEKDDKHHRLATKRISKDASWFQKKRPKIWRFMQDSYSSKPAMCYAFISLSVVLLSITVFMIETLPFFESIYVHSKKDRRNVTTQDLRLEIDIFGNTSPLAILLIIDHSCNLFFLCELMVKLIAAPYKKQFLISPQTIVEFVCLIPYYIAIIIVFYHPEPKNIFDLIRFMMSLRVLRIFRLFILMKHFLALKILMYTIRASTKELFLLLLVVLIGVVIFACIVYYMEMFSDQETQFEHIPMACWWALVTMTTVGYGDMVPSTGQGYAAGAVCALCGVLVIALSVPAIVQNFTLYYTHAQSRLKLKQRKRIYRRKKWSNLRNLLKDSDPSKNAFARIVSLAREENKKRRKSAAVAPFTQNKDSADKPVTKRGRSHSVAAAVSKRDVSGIFKRLAKTPNGNAKVQNTEETKPAAEKLDFTQSSKDLAKQSTSSGDVGNEKTPEIPKTSKVEEDEKVLDKQKDDTSTPVPKVKPICNNIPSISVNSETSEKKALPTLKEETNEETNDNFVSEKSSMYSFNFSRTSSFSNDSVIQEKSEKAKSRSRASSLSDRSYDSDMSDTELSMEFDKTVKSKSITAKDVWSRFMKKQNV